MNSSSGFRRANWIMAGVLAAGAAGLGIAAPPEFSDFPARIETVKKPAAVNLASDEKARRFRTVLRDGAAHGPNFAGRFTFIEWGCGTACIEFAIVDAKSGRVKFPSAVHFNLYQAVTDGSEPFQYRLDSRLLVLTGAPNDEDAAGVYYYEWTGKDLRLLGSELRQWPR